MDIVELFEENGIRVWTSGKNVSKGWIGLQCPYCIDDTNHLGVRLSDYKVRCWKCGGKRLSSILHTLLNISYREAFKLIKDELEPPDSPMEDEDVEVIDRVYEGKLSVKLPEEATKHFPKLHLDYLRSRNFKPRKLIRQYHLRAVNLHGQYKFRIIIPVFYDGRIITFTSRDVTDAAEERYKAAPKKTYPNIDHYIYGLSRIPQGGSAILVEGPSDVWRLGAGAISFFGTSQHPKQLAQLVKRRVRTVHILFDNDEPGKRASLRLAKEMASYVKEVNLLTLVDYPDPGKMSQEDADLLMMEIGLKE